ncbi:MAG: NAD(P)-dependent glycerol-3-phosphate dehydrogenase [Elusimicrobiota bacterium]|jgi:glycerol-3-phosphate dehydrogenase (NAD(P)+)|nr:NAD(P)-dependent glycerol-3-phosphate dehydrogenase [Elusimicrobiota bacterium]
MKINNITVLGAGLWGSVLAQHFAQTGFKVSLWEYDAKLLKAIQSGGNAHPNIPGFKFHQNITLTGDKEAAVKETDLLVYVISSKAIRGFSREIKPLLAGRVIPVISGSKGLEDKTFKTMCEIIEEELPHLDGMVFALSGPSFALEVAKGVPTKIILAGHNGPVMNDLRQQLSRPPVIFETSYDRRGAEYGGAIKNVIAIGCGILDGIALGANTKAALLTQAMAEMAMIMISQGCTAEAVYGLGGLGDAILTGMSAISRNRRLGEKLGQGLTLEQAKEQVGTIAEGANSVQSVYDLIQKNKLNCPVITAIWQILINGAQPRSILKALGFEYE